MGPAVGTGGDGPYVAGVAAVRVRPARPDVAVAPRGDDLAGVRTVLWWAARVPAALWAGWCLPGGNVRDADRVKVEPVGGLLGEQEDQFVADVRARQRPRLTWTARPAVACSRRCRYRVGGSFR